MDEFLQIALSFPTFVFSVFLAVAFLYWAMVIIGALDIEAFDHPFEGLLEGSHEGMAEGAGHGLTEGLAEGVGHGVAEGVGHGAVEGLGHGHALGEGLGDHAGEGAGHLVGHVSAAAAILAFLRVGKVPVTIVGSLLVVNSWALSFFGTLLVQRWNTDQLPQWASMASVTLLALLGGAVITSFVGRPLEPLFKSVTSHGQEALIGQLCRITSTKVDERFGRAEYDDRGAGLVLDVRSESSSSLARGHEAFIVGYDRARDVYLVEPLPPELEASSDALSRARAQNAAAQAAARQRQS